MKMNKKIISMIVAVTMLFSIAQSAMAIVRGSTIKNTQNNYDPYTESQFEKCYEIYNAGLNDNNFYFTNYIIDNIQGAGYLVYKDMDFGQVGASKVEFTYAHPNERTGKLQFRKNSPKGTILAEFDGCEIAKTTAYNDWTTVSADIINPADAIGTFDLYVTLQGQFYNINKFKFTEAPSAYTEINTLSEIKESAGFKTDDMEGAPGLAIFEEFVEGTELSATYNASFGEGVANKLIIGTSGVTTGGDITVKNETGEIIDQITLAATEGEGITSQTFVLDPVNWKDIYGVMDITFVFSPDIEGQLYDIKFEQGIYDPFAGDDNVNIVYLGGSITRGACATSYDKCWVSIVGNQLSEKYAVEGRTISHHNVAIGGTGSDFGLTRIEDDVISKNPDMVFVEFAVNDEGKEAGLWQMESIVKNLAELEKAPYVIFIYTTKAGLAVDSSYHNKVAEYYGIPTVDLQAIIKGDTTVNIDDLLEDGIHPNDAGYAYYAKEINKALESRDAFARPEFKEVSLSEISKIVDMRKITVDQFDVSGVEGTDWEIKDDPDGEKCLYMYTPGTTASVNFSGDTIALEDYIYNSNGMYSVSVNGRKVFTRDLYYDINWQKVNMGYFDMKSPYAENVTLTITMLEQKNSKVTADAAVVIGDFKYNTYKNPEEIRPESDVYNSINLTEYDEMVGGLGVSNDGLSIGNTNSGRYLVFKELNFDKGISAISLYSAGQDQSGTLEVRLDGTTGELIGKFAAPTFGWGVYGTINASDVKSVYGTHDVYFIFTGTFGDVRTIDFEPDLSGCIEAGSSLGTSNYVEKSEGVAIIDDNFDYFETNDYIKYRVDFGENFAYNVLRLSAAAEASSGKIIVREGSVAGTVIAEFDISPLASWTSYSSLPAKITESGQALEGEHDIYITFEGTEGYCILNSIGFDTAAAAEREYNTGNYSAISGASVSGNRFASYHLTDAYVEWASVDFGEVSKLRDVKVKYTNSATNHNAYINIRLDSPNGEIIAQAVAEYQAGITDWVTQLETVVPVTKEITGIHSLYLTVDLSEYSMGSKGTDIFGFEIMPVETEDEYVTSYNAYGEVYDSAAAAFKDPVNYNTILRFLKSDTTPAEILFAVGLYDENDRLVGVTCSSIEVKDGVNSAALNIPHSLVGDGTYKLKEFVWDAETLSPVDGEATVLEENIIK